MSDPYAKPEADLGGASAAASYQPKFLSTQGRIGRLRYLAYGMGASMLLYCVALPAALFLSAKNMTTDSPGSSAVMMIAIAFLYVAAFAVYFVYTKRRLNDLGQTGWLSLLLLVPLVNLILWGYVQFVPGQPQSNPYGPKPVANTTGIIILACFPILLSILGILAAISIPAYQDYVQRAAQAQSQLEQ